MSMAAGSTLWRHTTVPDVIAERSLRRGMRLSELALGVAQFGNLYRETREDECESAIESAWGAGIRYFDTAPHYGLGLSERRLGNQLRALPRDEFILSTKVGRLLVPTPETAGELDSEFVVPAAHRREWDFSADGVRRSLEGSLERLGLDRIDIVYVHDPDHAGDEVVDVTFPALVRLREEGTIGAIGAGMNQAAMLARFVREADIDVVMVAGRFTLLDHSALDELLPIAQQRGVGVVVAGVYNSGLLSAPVVRSDAHFDYGPAPEHMVDRARRIASACERHGVTLPDAALAYPLLHPAVVSVVVGARNGEQVRSNVARYQTPVPSALWSDLRSEGLLSTRNP